MNELTSIIKAFNNPCSTKNQIKFSGEQLVLALYKANNVQNLDDYRYQAFTRSVHTKKGAVILSSLPPTSASAEEHSYRVFHQIQSWLENYFNPEDWGWKRTGNHLAPICCKNKLHQKKLKKLSPALVNLAAQRNVGVLKQAYAAQQCAKIAMVLNVSINNYM